MQSLEHRLAKCTACKHHNCTTYKHLHCTACKHPDCIRTAQHASIRTAQHASIIPQRTSYKGHCCRLHASHRRISFSPSHRVSPGLCRITNVGSMQNVDHQDVQMIRPCPAIHTESHRKLAALRIHREPQTQHNDRKDTKFQNRISPFKVRRTRQNHAIATRLGDRRRTRSDAKTIMMRI